MDTDLDVLVVGGGPVGLFAAHELCRHGVSPDRIRVIDKRPKQKLWCKAVGVQARTQEVLFASNGDLSDRLQNASINITKACFYRYPRDAGDDGKSFADNELVIGANLNELPSQFKSMTAIEQYNTENFIADELSSKYDMKLERGIELVQFKDMGSFVEVELSRKHPDDQNQKEDKPSSSTETLRVKALIGADGTRSFVRSRLGLSYEGQSLSQRWVLFHGEFNDNGKLPRPSTFMMTGELGFVFCISLKDGTWYCVADLDEKQEKEIHKRHGGKMKCPTVDDIEWVLRQRGFNGITVKSTRWLSTFTVDSRQISQYSKGRVYLAGDACHCHSPVNGQGMNMGLQDIHNLAWKLAMVINKKCSASLLESYNTERFNVDKAVVEFVDVATKQLLVRERVALYLRTQFQKAMFTSFRWMIDAQLQTMGQITYTYNKYSTLSFEYWKPPSIFPHLLYRRQQNITRLFRPRLHAGDRCPDFIVPDDEGNDEQFANQRLHTLFRETTHKPFVVLLFEGNPEFKCPFSDIQDLKTFKSEIEASQCGQHCKVVMIKSVHRKLHSEFGAYQQCMFLVRPDQYIGLRSQPMSLDALHYYLSKRLLVNSVRIGDDALCRVKNMERRDPVPAILATTAISAIAYFVGSRYLPHKYQPTTFVSKLWGLFV